MHSIVAFTGAVLAAIGGVMLLTRFFRAPRGDLAAWTIGLLGLLVSLGAQLFGYAKGFDSTTFRAMELGGQVVAPLAFLTALAEVAGRSALGRFCARLYIGALGIVAVVILALDQLTTARFSTSFPPAATFYQTPPNYVLMYAIGPLTALIAVIAMLMVLARSGRPGWKAAVWGQLMGGVAALCLAYPGLAELASHHVKRHIPLGSVFAILCTIAVVLGWLAAEQSASLSLAALHGQLDGDDAWPVGQRPGDAAGYAGFGGDGYDRAGRYYRPDRYGRTDGYGSGPDRRLDNDASYSDPFGQGVYRGGGLYRPEPGRVGRGERPDGPGGDWADGRASSGYADFKTGDYLAADMASDEQAWDGPQRVVRGGEWHGPEEVAWDDADADGGWEGDPDQGGQWDDSGYYRR